MYIYAHFLKSSNTKKHACEPFLSDQLRPLPRVPTSIKSIDHQYPVTEVLIVEKYKYERYNQAISHHLNGACKGLNHQDSLAGKAKEASKY